MTFSTDISDHATHLLSVNHYRVVGNEKFSNRVLVNTGSTLIQAANDEEWVVGQHTLGPKVRVLNKHVYIQIYFHAGRLQMKSRGHKFP